MRDLSQCKAEILRRSKLRMDARRRRCAVAITLAGAIFIGLTVWITVGRVQPSVIENYDDSSFQSRETAPAVGAASGWPPAYSSTFNFGNTQATVRFQDGTTYTLTAERTAAVMELLGGLEYDRDSVCDCYPEYQLQTEGGSYGVHLTERYARCERGQAKLTDRQVLALRELINCQK